MISYTKLTMVLVFVTHWCFLIHKGLVFLTNNKNNNWYFETLVLYFVNLLLVFSTGGVFNVTQKFSYHRLLTRIPGDAFGIKNVWP